MNINLTISDAVAARVVDALAQAAGWTPASSQTKAQAAKGWVVGQVMAVVERYEATNAIATAQQTAVAKVRKDVTIT